MDELKSLRSSQGSQERTEEFNVNKQKQLAESKKNLRRKTRSSGLVLVGGTTLVSMVSMFTIPPDAHSLAQNENNFIEQYKKLSNQLFSKLEAINEKLSSLKLEFENYILSKSKK